MSAPSSASYAAVLRTPLASRTFAAALLGRLSYGMLPLSLVLTVKDATGSYAVAGTVSALFGAFSVLLNTTRAGLVDRFGPRRALLPMAGTYGVLLVLLALVCGSPGAPSALIGAVAVCAGSCTPPLGPTMRTLWARLMPDRTMLRRAYSLDGVAEELLFMAGPLIVGWFVLHASPRAGLPACAALVVVGTSAMMASPVAGYAESGAAEAKAARGRKRIPGLALPVAVAAGVGVLLGGADLLAVAFTDAHGRPAAVAWVLAALSVGSAVGGLVNGAVVWRSAARPRLAVTALVLGVALSAAGLSPDVYVLAVAAAVTGLFIAPAITNAYLIADDAAGSGSRTRAGAWVNTGLNAGSSLGTAAVGVAVGRLPTALCFVLVAVPVLGAAVTGLCAAAGVRGARGGQSSEPESSAESSPVPSSDRSVP